MEPKGKHEIHVCFINTLYTYLKVILDNIFKNFMHETRFRGLEFTSVALCLHSESFGFWSILEFRWMVTIVNNTTNVNTTEQYA
jgi:hypothetical protein